MEIWHRITFGRGDAANSGLETLGLKVERNELPGGSYTLHLSLVESDPRWPEVASLVRQEHGLDVCETFFSEEEIRSAEWVRLLAGFEAEYPQPERNWSEITYEGSCPKCGIGFRQVAPFRLKHDPRMGRNDFLCLYWTVNTVFCTARVVEALKAAGIRGYEVWPAILHKADEPSRLLSQLVFPLVAEPGLAEEDKQQPETCPKCGMTKYKYHNRGYMHIRRDAIRQDVDAVKTHEWFGSDRADAWRENLISNRFAQLILDKGWRGVRLKPVKLI